MNVTELQSYLQPLIHNRLHQAVMLWGKPGIGKSSIVRSLCEQNELQFIDVRLSQLMPSDLRGIPVPDQKMTHWYPPAFLPQEGEGILFMDEINMAPPALQGVAQQLVLDRQVGDYRLPDGWLVWAAGNHSTDRAAVYDMPAPLANRFIHLTLNESINDFRAYALATGLHPDVIGFVSFRSDLLHKMHPTNPAWPSPRSWEMAARLHQIGLSIESAVGDACALEFHAFCRLQHDLPDMDAILKGTSTAEFPQEPSLRYALICHLISRSEKSQQAVHCFEWLIEQASSEWIQMFVSELVPVLKQRKQYSAFTKKIIGNEKARQYLTQFAGLMMDLE